VTIHHDEVMFPEAVRTYRTNAGPFVYFIVETPSEDGWVKIGTARDPLARLRELQVGNPRRLWIAALLVGGKDLEERWHIHWMEARNRGEWFGNGYGEAIVAMAQAGAEPLIPNFEPPEPVVVR
jgi:hypothetical protein